MIWLFDRGGKQLKYEICRNENGAGYLLVMTSSDGEKRVERIEQPTEVIDRSLDQMHRLHNDGWKIG